MLKRLTPCAGIQHVIPFLFYLFSDILPASEPLDACKAERVLAQSAFGRGFGITRGPYSHGNIQLLICVTNPRLCTYTCLGSSLAVYCMLFDVPFCAIIRNSHSERKSTRTLQTANFSPLLYLKQCTKSAGVIGISVRDSNATSANLSSW